MHPRRVPVFRCWCYVFPDRAALSRPAAALQATAAGSVDGRVREYRQQISPRLLRPAAWQQTR